MRCPNCGSPVMVYTNRWECGYCGDCGALRTGTQTITLSFKVVSNLDFDQTWSKMKECLSQYAEKLVPQLGNVLIYEISHAMTVSGHTTDNEKFQELDEFLQSDPLLREGPNIRDIIQASKLGEELCVAEGKLTEDACGGFWQRLIRTLPSEDDPEELEDLLYGLGAFYQYFVSDEWGGENLTRFRELRDAFEYHWYRHRYFFPDLGAAIARLQADDIGCIQDDCRDILVSGYPNLFQKYTLEDMEDLQWNFFLEDLAEYEPALARAMWETLLAAAGPDFTRNPTVEEYLTGNNPFADDN